MSEAWDVLFESSGGSPDRLNALSKHGPCKSSLALARLRAVLNHEADTHSVLRASDNSEEGVASHRKKCQADYSGH
jgi:hypothetical protein